MTLNDTWERRIKDCNTDFAYFIDAAALPAEAVAGYTCAVLFGKALPREYLCTLRAGGVPARNEFANLERRMDALAIKIAERLEAEGYRSAGKLKIGVLPHKTAALRAGIGFIGKNNLLVTEQYGCAVVLGKVLTAAPFKTISSAIMNPRCGDCAACVNACPAQALLGATWSITAAREQILTRKLCTLCLQCVAQCPYTVRYAENHKNITDGR